MGNCCVRDHPAAKDEVLSSHSKSGFPANATLQNPGILSSPTPMETPNPHATATSQTNPTQGSTRSKRTPHHQVPSKPTVLSPSTPSAIPIKRLTQDFESIYEIKSKGIQFEGSLFMLGVHMASQKTRLIMKVPRVDASGDEEVMRRVSILGQMEHPSVLKCTSILYDDKFFYATTESFSGTRFVGYGTVADAQSEEVVKNVAVQMLSGLAYSHSKHHIITTLSIINTIFFQCHTSRRIMIKLLVFGGQQKLAPNEFKSMKNNQLFVAPEGRENQFTDKADVWSCGVILFILLTKSAPFLGNDEAELAVSIAQGAKFHRKVWSRYDASAQDLIASMLNLDPQSRPSAAECLQHEWLLSPASPPPALFQPAMVNLRKFQGGSPLKLAILTFIVMYTLEPDEKLPLHDVFAYINASKTGLISKKELSRAFVIVSSVELAESLASDVLRKLDSDGDASIDFTEFLLATVDYQLLLHSKRIQIAFYLFDPESTGFINLNDLRLVLKYKETAENWEQFLRESGIDGSGNIGKREFTLLIKSLVTGISGKKA